MKHTFWEPQITSLCDEFRTIAIDLRGHGRSDKPSRGYAFDDHCKDLKRLMEELKVEDATLMGWSTGGGIATKYAATIKDHIIQLGLVGPTSPRFVSNPDYIHGVPLEAVRAMIDEELRDRPASERIKDCEVIMFEALGHAVHLEDPIFFNKMLRRFLEI